MNEGESVGSLVLRLLVSHSSSPDANKCTSEPYIENIRLAGRTPGTPWAVFAGN